MLIDELKRRKIIISLRPLKPNDLAANWEIKAIIENPDIFDDFFGKYPLNGIETLDDYYQYLLARKLQSLSVAISEIVHDEHKTVITALSNAARNSVKSIQYKNVIKFIDNNIDDVFHAPYAANDIRSVTLDLIAKWNPGVCSSSLEYICDHFGHYIVERFEEFERLFEQKPELFEIVFHSGKLDDVSSFWFEKVLDIWCYILNKKSSKLRSIVEKYIPILFSGVVSLAETATIDNVLHIYIQAAPFYQFLIKIRSPLANQFMPIFKNIDALLNQNICEKGASFSFTIPVGDIVENWKSLQNWEERLLALTHDRSNVDGYYHYVSRLSDKRKSNYPITNLALTNIPIDDYYTENHQLWLSFQKSVETASIFRILQETRTASDYFSLISSAIKYISETLQVKDAGMEQDVELLVSMIQIVVRNLKADTMIVHSLCYGAEMFACSFSEKLLRVFYRHLTKDREYIPSNKATLGQLFSENNDDIVNIFGLEHIKNLSFFLMKTPQTNIGDNMRNNLAHWSDLSVNALTPMHLAQLLWLFTDIMNTIFWHLLSTTLVQDESNTPK